MSERKLFCLIKQTDNQAAIEAETMMKFKCGCGWPEQPCLSMHPDLRRTPTIFAQVYQLVPASQRDWNRRARPMRQTR